MLKNGCVETDIYIYIYVLYVKASKCFFGVLKIEYLGHFITEQDVSTDSQKVKDVKYWPTPTTLKQFRVFFFRLTDYYRRFIQGLVLFVIH